MSITKKRTKLKEATNTVILPEKAAKKLGYQFKDALAYLRDFMTHAMPQERKKLWDFVTALRGPDNDDFNLKKATTAVIRWKAFGDEAFEGYWITRNKDTKSFKERRKKMEDDPKLRHFIRHAKNGFRMLRMRW